MLKIDRDLRQTIEHIAQRRPEARAQLEQLLEGKLQPHDVEHLLDRHRFEPNERAALLRVVGGAPEVSATNLRRPAGTAQKGAVSLSDLRRAETARRAGQGAPSWWGAMNDHAPLELAFALTGAASEPQTVQVGGETFTPHDVEQMLGGLADQGTPTPRLAKKSQKRLRDLEEEL